LSILEATATNGTVIINKDGTLKYTPNANYYGVDTISYKVSDGKGGTDTATVKVTIKDDPNDYILGQNVIDLNGYDEYNDGFYRGEYGNLINPIYIDNDNDGLKDSWFYFWDKSGDAVANSADKTTHDITIDGLFNHDINGIINSTMTNTDGAYGTTNDYRYATIDGIKLALLTNGLGSEQGGRDLYDNVSVSDLAEIWDSFNVGVGTNGTPNGWASDYYLTASENSSGHAYISLANGHFADDNDTENYYVALQVL